MTTINVNIGDTVIFDPDGAGNFDNPHFSNVGIVIDKPVDEYYAPKGSAYYARWGDGKELWFYTNSNGIDYKIIPKKVEPTIEIHVIDELCDLLVEACTEGHSLMQTKTLRRVQAQLKNLGKPALVL